MLKQRKNTEKAITVVLKNFSKYVKAVCQMFASIAPYFFNVLYCKYYISWLKLFLNKVSLTIISEFFPVYASC